MPSPGHLGLKPARGGGRGQLEEGTITGASRDQLPNAALLLAVFQLGGLGCATGALHTGGTTSGPKGGTADIGGESGTVTQRAQEQPVAVAAPAVKASCSWRLGKGGDGAYVSKVHQ